MQPGDKGAPGERLVDHSDPVGTCPGSGLDVSLIPAAAAHWHSRHQRAEDLPSYSAERWQERAAGDALTFVARGSGRIHGPGGDGEGEGEWRMWAWPGAPVNGPEVLLGISFDWEDDIAESAEHESLGGIALDLASCERLAEAAAHAAAVLRAGRWVSRPVPSGLQSLVDEAIANAAANGYDVLAGDLRAVAVDIMDHAPAVQEMVESGTLPGDDVGIGMVAAAVLTARMAATGWRRVAEDLEVLEGAAEELDAQRQRVAEIEAELAREREQVRVARAQCARAQADRDAARAALISATSATAVDVRVAELEAELETERHWWPLADGKATRGWAVILGEEEPNGPYAVFSSEEEARGYVTWRQALEQAKPDEERHPCWEYANVLPAELQARFWNSFDPAPAADARIAHTAEHQIVPKKCLRPCVECSDGTHHFGEGGYVWAHDEPKHEAAKAGHQAWMRCYHCPAWVPYGYFDKREADLAKIVDQERHECEESP